MDKDFIVNGTGSKICFLTLRKQTNLDLERLLDEVINLLFSTNGGFLRNEIVDGLTNQIDLLSLKILKSLNNYLPKSIKLNTINENNNLSDF